MTCVKKKGMHGDQQTWLLCTGTTSGFLQYVSSTGGAILDKLLPARGGKSPSEAECTELAGIIARVLNTELPSDLLLRSSLWRATCRDVCASMNAVGYRAAVVASLTMVDLTRTLCCGVSPARRRDPSVGPRSDARPDRVAVHRSSRLAGPQLDISSVGWLPSCAGHQSTLSASFRATLHQWLVRALPQRRGPAAASTRGAPSAG